MGVLCRFSNYDENHDIVGAVYLHKYIISQERLPGKSTFRKKKTGSLSSLLDPVFIGCSFEILKNTMHHFGITFELYFDHKCILSNKDENEVISGMTKS